MKQITIVLSLLTLTCFSQLAFAENQSGKVVRMNLYGGEWSNSWKGGMLYKLDTMPAGIYCGWLDKSWIYCGWLDKSY